VTDDSAGMGAPPRRLAKAIDYLLGMWRGLVRFLEDPASQSTVMAPSVD
jgi:hypothetical protein